MKRARLTGLLKALVIVAVVLGLYICVYLMPSSVRLMALLYPAVGPHIRFAIVYCWLIALPIFVALAPTWKIFDSIGRDESFSEANAQRLKWVHWLALVDLLLLLVGFALARVVVPGSPVLVFCFITGGFLCLAASIACLVLSQLIQQATLLQRENDYTV